MKSEHQILIFEKDFFNTKFCNSIEKLNKRIHDDFIEFGKLGQVFNKNSIIEYLSTLDKDRDIEIIAFEIKNINEDLIIINYISYEKEIDTRALRTSIWKKEDLEWKLYFHQGTITKLDTI